MPRFDLSLRRARLADLAALVRLEECFPSDRLSRRNFRHLLKHGNADFGWLHPRLFPEWKRYVVKSSQGIKKRATLKNNSETFF